MIDYKPRISRLLNMIFVLQNRHSVRVKELSEKYNVSLKTIYRDFEILDGAGIPVYSEKGKYYIL